MRTRVRAGFARTPVEPGNPLKRIRLLGSRPIGTSTTKSGAAEPSAQDRALTDKIARAAALFDIRLLDHLIISREGDFSFLREGLL